MAKQTPAIRWRKRDTELLQRKINNFNRKIARVKKSHPELADIQPERVKRGDILKGIKTRADFNRVIKELEGYTQRGAEKQAPSKRGRKTTLWEDSVYRKRQAAVNRKKKHEFERLGSLETTSRGVPTGVKRAEMGEVWKQEYRPSKRDTSKMSQTEWDKFKRAMDTAIMGGKKELYRENYIKALRHEQYDERIIELIMSIPIDVFVDIMTLEIEAELPFYYNEADRAMHNDVVLSTWEELVADYHDGKLYNY